MKTIFASLLCLFLSLTLPAQQPSAIADSNNFFAFKLYTEVNKENSKGNLFFSPFSISAALAMTYAGARNQTEKQMRQTLHFNLSRNTFQAEYKSYLEAIQSDTGKGMTMEIANSLWVDNNCKLLKPFSDIVKNDFAAESRNVDFLNEPEPCREEINTWVEGKTHDKIKDLIAKGMISPKTRLVLVNAIYFNGKWEIPFSKEATKKDTFYRDGSKGVMRDFMNKTALYKYYDDSLLQAIEIPYNGEKTSMIVLLPKEMNGISSMEKQIDNSYYAKITSTLQKQRVKLKLPKFKTTEEFELTKSLAAMGMPIAFSSNADFSGITDKTDLRLKISAVIHKAFVDVNEEGTEAAAATAVVMKLTNSMPPRNLPIFTANHPFLFVIRYNATGSILFMGKITDPGKKIKNPFRYLA